jgi:lipoic acid synthetase
VWKIDITPEAETEQPRRRPEWLKVRLPHGPAYQEVRDLVESNELHTVCQEARCPNMGECWGRRTATFMILGDVCTRSCGFCAVKTGRPMGLDLDEPLRVAEAIARLDLRHAVITSVNRDELEDGGAGIFAETIRQSRRRNPACRIEVLIPDFKGSYEALKLVIDARPDILNHNTETVPSLYRTVRPQGRYQWSLDLLERAKRHGRITKTGLMLGLGESLDEVRVVMGDLRQREVDILTLGQYLQPTKRHLPVARFVTPEEFCSLREEGLAMGFRYVESGPLVRSSYHADEQVFDELSN